LVLGQAMGNLDSQNSPWRGLEGNHLPPYSILYTSPQGSHPNGFLSRLGLLQLWGAIILRTDLWLRWGLKQSCSPRWELSNDMFHAIFTHGNRVDFWLLVVESQIVNLIPCPSFGHKLRFRCPNGQCDPILDIYIPRSFQWYKERLKPLRFDP
jgi:hypothetical protein